MIQSKTEPSLHCAGAKRKLEDLRKLLTLHQHKQPIQTSVSSNNLEMTFHQKSSSQNSQPLPQKAIIFLEKQKTAKNSKQMSEKLKILQITQLTTHPQRIVEKTKPIETDKQNSSAFSNIGTVVHRPLTKEIQINVGMRCSRQNKNCESRNNLARTKQIQQEFMNCRKENLKLKMEIDFLETIEKKAIQLETKNQNLDKQKKQLIDKNYALQTQLSIAHRQIQQYRQQVQELYVNIEIMRRNQKNKQIENFIQKSLNDSFKSEQIRSHTITQRSQKHSPRSQQVNQKSNKSLASIDKQACLI